MNQRHDYPYPPPPPTPGGVNAPAITSLAHHQRMLPAQPPGIATTNLSGALGVPSQTPISATSLSPAIALSLTPNSPGVAHPRTPGALATPSSARSPAMEPYDPRQWSSRRELSGSQMVFQHRMSGAPGGTRDATGMEATMPSPPPPYSPESTSASSNRQIRPVSMIEGFGYTASPVQLSASTSSPQGPMSPSFPPPPGQSSRFRERSSSGQRAFFNLTNLRKHTTSAESQSSQTGLAAAEIAAVPPASKRASSTGQLQQHQAIDGPSVPLLGPARKLSPSSSLKPGVPLPGPPPGPPPPAARTQSLNRYSEGSSRSNSIGSDKSIEVPAHRRGAAAASSLGPIPPTPAGWVDTDNPSSQPFARPLRIDTGSGHDAPLTRRPAKRDSSGHGIRERRSRSRAAKDGTDLISPDSNCSRPDDLVLATSQGSISKRRDRTRLTPGDRERTISSSSQDDTPNSGTATNHVLTPPYTPALGRTHDESSSRKFAFRAAGGAVSERPISQVLQQAVEDSTAPLTSSPARPLSSTSAQPSGRLDPFLLQALERHRALIEKEALATSDKERLELFANFLVNESRLRRDRYAEAYNVMAGDIMDLTRDMWRSFGRQGKQPDTPGALAFSSDPAVYSGLDGRPGTASGNIPSSASSFEGYTPATDSGSLLEGGDPMERCECHQRGEIYKPSLSPIPSMAISSVADDEGSRGRAPSRWFETSNSDSNSIGKPERIEKSHRETKYMGVNVADLQQTEHESPRHSWYASSTAGPSVESSGNNEYPPEKVGWHEQADVETPMPTPGRARKTSTPGMNELDVSRLVTLPPPYPRHYPAVKNKHPLLSGLRNEYRSLADHTKIREIRETFLSQDSNMHRQQEEAKQERRKQLRVGIQSRIADGTMSYAEAAQAEADFEAEEAGRGTAVARSSFDVFEASFAHPLNSLLTERLAKASECINQLRVELESQNEVSDPNQAQEEGDEQPERLERLTLLKWLFETREQLHKEMCELHADRSAKYSEVILTPFRIAKEQAKIDDATAFFAKDNLDRQIGFAKDSLQRFREFREIVDSNVTLGVEDQLSAFWDIAPALLEVIQHIPTDMANLEVRIPDQEYMENPAYNHHPLQYLYSLLSHAQKSAYQFIESQTNLLCLRHEVQIAAAKSKMRFTEIECAQARPGDDHMLSEMQQARQEQEEGLTNDLKEKVGEVERQWEEALGENLEECKGRVKMYLQDTEGWEEGLDG